MRQALNTKVTESKATEGRGRLVVIGGGEDRTGEMRILREVAEQVGDSHLVVITVASSQGDELFDVYEKAFAKFGVTTARLPIGRREDAQDPAKCRILEDAAGVFFTGGDQLKITSELGGTPACELIYAIHARGGVVAGTSAGASALGQTMPISGGGDDSARVRDQLRLVPALGFLKDVILDQHFAQRGRLGRIIGAVAQNPGMLGIGIDEDTALIVHGETRFSVIGSGAVTVADGREITRTNVNDAEDDHTMSVFDLRLHVLSAGDQFDLTTRRPHAAHETSE